MEELASYSIAEASINQYHPSLGNGEGGGMACAFHSLSFIDHIQRQDFCLKLRSNSVLAPVATELIREDLPCLTDDTATTMATEILLAGTGLAKQGYCQPTVRLRWCLDARDLCGSAWWSSM